MRTQPTLDLGLNVLFQDAIHYLSKNLLFNLWKITLNFPLCRLNHGSFPNPALAGHFLHFLLDLWEEGINFLKILN
jgi:hypothetical protein